MKTFGSKCEGIYPNFTITSLVRMVECFGGDNILRVNRFGDIAVATPICN